MKDYFEVVLDLQEKLARNEISFEEFEKEMSKLEPTSIQLNDGLEDIDDSNNSLKDLMREQNEFFKGQLFGLDEEYKEIRSRSEEIKKLAQQVKSKVEPTINEISNRINRETISDVSSKISSFGMKVLSASPKKLRQIKESINLGKKECIHEIVYLSSEVSPYRFESERFRNLNSTKLIVVKCLECGKEFMTSREKIQGRLIESEKDYEEVRKVYKQVKDNNLSTEEIVERIYSKLNGEIKLTL